jgi:hypothetical protein
MFVNIVKTSNMALQSDSIDGIKRRLYTYKNESLPSPAGRLFINPTSQALILLSKKRYMPLP